MGDTIFNGITYKKVYYRGLNSVRVNGRWAFTPSTFTSLKRVFLREDTVQRKVYVYQPEIKYVYGCPKGESVLYDFSVEQGDTTEQCLSQPAGPNTTIDTVFYSQDTREWNSGGSFGSPPFTSITEFDSLKRWNLSNGVFMVEAIGGSEGFLRTLGRAIGYNSWTQNYCRGTNCDSLIVPNPTLSIESDLEARQWKIFPNPAHEIVTITYSGNKVTHPANLSLFDITGKEALPRKAWLPAQNEVKWDISSLSPGVYFLAIEREGAVLRKKVVVVGR